MKKILTAAFCILVVVFAVLRFHNPKAQSRGPQYDAGYSQALRAAPQMVEERLLYDLWYISSQIDKEYGVDLEDALRVITNYAEGEPISQDELKNAIWALYEYHRDSYDLFEEISSYDLE